VAVKFDLPIDLEISLRQEIENLDELAKEAAMVELYRQEKLSQHELGIALGLTRLETEAMLKKHNVTEDFLTSEEYETALSRLRKLADE